MKKKMTLKTIRCKRADDVILVREGPNTQSVVNALMHGVPCGHRHLIVVGHAKFVERATEVPADFADTMELQVQAETAYQNNPLARVFVQTLAQQLGGEPSREFIHAVLAHARLLNLLAKGQLTVESKTKEAERKPGPAIYLPPGVRP